MTRLHRFRPGLTTGFMICLVLCIGVGAVSAVPPSVDGERNNLSAAEVATLWSRDADTGSSVTLAEAREGGDAIRDIANGTDFTFQRPPPSAATWTRHDFQNFEYGSTDTSVHPPDVDLEHGRFVKDAYTTLFSVHPSTRAHITPGRTPLFIAPDGIVLATVDYRIEVPSDTLSEDREVFWSLDRHGIERIQLRSGGQVLNSTSSTHSPSFGFNELASGERTLTVDATISVQMEKKVKRRHFMDDIPKCREDEDNDNDREDDDGDGEVDEEEECYYWTTHYQYPEETVKVNDSVDVTVYRIQPEIEYARFPDDRTEVLVMADRPWTGFTAEELTVTGIWRFYTARDTQWDHLYTSSNSGSQLIDSDSIPVSVHAYPSGTGVQSRPLLETGILDFTGAESASPKSTIGENVSVDVVNGSYQQSRSILVRVSDPDFDPDTVQVNGIVRGEPVTPDRSDVDRRNVRESNLTIEAIRTNESQATLRILLRENRTGQPIVLRDSQRQSGEPRRDGYIAVDGHRVETNRSGMALVTVERSGSYTARYHPESWVSVEPAYTGDTDSVRWHSLTTIDAWFHLLIRAFWLALPFAVVYYAGTKLLALFGSEKYR